ncbi:hypothetical protein I3843_01G184400 [Carya illinoinensis]|nr:hypothetical protein I3843_01G184400 [Carya illinoinensis]
MPDCNCGKLVVINDRYQRDCVIQFLMGLNESFNATRDQIMLLDPLPPIKKIFSMVQQQEMQHLVLKSTPSPDSMALAVKQPYTAYKPFSKPLQPFKRDRPFCTHCKIQGHTLDNCFKAGNAQAPICIHCHMTGHLADKCYKVHGYPPGHKLHGKPKQLSFPSANMTSLEPENPSINNFTLTKDQYQQLLSLLPSKEVSIAPHSVNHVQADCSSSSTMNGNSFCFTSSIQTSHTNTHSPWIIDTGATDHMICNTSFFSSITSHVSFKIKLPNGHTAPATHIGTVHLTPTLILHNVLCVPSFTFNLISAKQLTSSLSCCFVFLSQFCFLQDLLSWTTIGMGEIKDGLYQLLAEPMSPSALLDHFSFSLHKTISVSASFERC